MFGLGMPEILLILAIALIVIGPKKLPDLAKTLGRAMGEFKRSAQDFKRSIDLDTSVQEVTPPSPELKTVIKETHETTEKEEGNGSKIETEQAQDNDAHNGPPKTAESSSQPEDTKENKTE